jgi:hypothetical protein
MIRIRQFAKPDQDVLWGYDIDEGQPQRLILDMASLNPGDAKLQQMIDITSHSYRKQASELLSISETEHPLAAQCVAAFLSGRIFGPHYVLSPPFKSEYTACRLESPRTGHERAFPYTFTVRSPRAGLSVFRPQLPTSRFRCTRLFHPWEFL